MRRCFFLGLALIGIPAFCGCGSSDGLYPVRGKVLCKGEPAVGAEVYFHRKDVADPLTQQIPQGIVQQDGTFELAGATGKGALPGDYVVLIEWREGAGKTPGRSPPIGAPDRFKGKYLDPKKPQFQAQVKTAKNQLAAFEIQ